MSFLHFFEWLQNTGWASALRESSLVFPIVEGIHLLALSASVGAIAICDLRLLGVLMKREPVSTLMKHVWPWSLAGYAVMFASGSLLFASEAVKCYGNGWFRLKVFLLLLAGVNAAIFHLTVYKSVAGWDVSATPPFRARLAGGFSLFIWALVIAAGRTTAYNL